MKKKAKRKKSLTKNQKKRFFLLIFSSMILIILVVLFVFWNPFKSKKTNFVSQPVTLSFVDRVEDLKQYVPEEETTYVVGWLQVQGTNIDFPILDYGEKDVSKELDNGWRSPNYLTGENREVLLGHNIINISSTPIRDMENLSGFEGLLAFVYEDIAQENLYISYTKGNDTELYKIYAINFSNYDDDDSYSFSSEDEVKKYIRRVRNSSIYDYDIDVDETDKLITLKTCTRYFGAEENQEFSIDARLVRDGEEIETYEVKKNTNYETLFEKDSF